MFGHQDQTDPNNQNAPQAADPQADATLGDHTASASQPTATAPAIDDSAASDFLMDDEPQTAGVSNAPATPAPTATTPPVIHHDATSKDDTSNDLLDLKQQALQQLTPLVDHLDQTPEEKFRTTMMMIQASDNQALLKTAYEAAQAIEDEKTRAQALLDVVNEINYFTQSGQDNSSEQE